MIISSFFFWWSHSTFGHRNKPLCCTDYWWKGVETKVLTKKMDSCSCQRNEHLSRSCVAYGLGKYERSPAVILVNGQLFLHSIFWDVYDKTSISTDWTSTSTTVKWCPVQSVTCAGFASRKMERNVLIGGIDEGMLKWRGRLFFSGYMKDKPVKCSVKSCILADSRTGYCWNLGIYHKEQNYVGNHSMASHWQMLREGSTKVCSWKTCIILLSWVSGCLIKKITLWGPLEQIEVNPWVK